MTKLTNDLLYLARIDHDDGNVIFSKVSFSEAAESVILLMEAVIFENNVNLTYDITPDLFVNGSTEQLKQLVMILLDNAVKYTPKSGDINITLTHESSDAVLTVRNTGVGISEDAQKQISTFHRFLSCVLHPFLMLLLPHSCPLFTLTSRQLIFISIFFIHIFELRIICFF